LLREALAAENGLQRQWDAGQNRGARSKECEKPDVKRGNRILSVRENRLLPQQAGLEITVAGHRLPP
jgi:hypothetical protein